MPNQPKQPNPNIIRQSVDLRPIESSDGARIVEAIVSTGQRIRDWSWEIGDHDRVMVPEGFKGLRGGFDQCPFNDTHDDGSIEAALGSARNFQIIDGALKCTVHFLDAGLDELADKAWALREGGHVKAVSLGAQALDGGVTTIPANESAVILGKSYTAGAVPLRVWSGYEIFELSMCQRGADKGAVMQYHTAEPGENKEPQAMKDETTGGTPPTPGTVTQAAAPNPANVVDIEEVRQKALAEGKRLGAENVETIRQMGTLMNMPEDVIKQAVGMTPDAATKFYFENAQRAADVVTQAARSGPAIIVRDNDINEDRLVATLIFRAADDTVRQSFVRKVEAKGDRGLRDIDFAERNRDLDLVEICRQSLRISGKEAPLSKREIVRQALSTPALSNIFTTSINATLRAAYDYIPSTTGWCAHVPVNNFQTQDIVLTENSDKLELTGTGARPKHMTSSDAVESYKVYRFSKKATIDEMDIVNDNLRYFSQLPREMAGMASEVEPDYVYALMLANGNMRDSNALFDATNHLNKAASNSALSADSLAAGVAAMKKQKIADAQNPKRTRTLNIDPRYLIVPPTLAFKAASLLNSTELRDTTANTKYGTSNAYIRGLGLTLVVEPRLENGCFNPVTETSVNGSTTGWYLAADPIMGKTMEVGYLSSEGIAPTLESAPIPVGEGWGYTYTVKLTRGAKPVDWRGWWFNAGA